MFKNSVYFLSLFSSMNLKVTSHGHQPIIFNGVLHMCVCVREREGGKGDGIKEGG